MTGEDCKRAGKTTGNHIGSFVNYVFDKIKKDSGTAYYIIV